MRSFWQNDLTFPKSQPRLNTAHPLYSQEHMIVAAVADRKNGMINLVNREIKTNTNTATRLDDMGLSLGNPNLSVPATVSMLFTNIGPSTVNFITWGVIWKHMVSGSGTNLIQLDVPATAQFRIGDSFAGTNQVLLWIGGGSQFTFPLIFNHTYFFLSNNAVGTAEVNRCIYLLDMTTGMVVQAFNTSTGNIALNPQIQVVNSGYTNSLATETGNYTYAAFMTGSVNVPPSVVDPPTFTTRATMQATLNKPWSLWYADD